VTAVSECSNALRMSFFPQVYVRSEPGIRSNDTSCYIEPRVDAGAVTDSGRGIELVGLALATNMLG
jgi:hypothetical protein